MISTTYAEMLLMICMNKRVHIFQSLVTVLLAYQ
jgi:hypothetical protein